VGGDGIADRTTLTFWGAEGGKKRFGLAKRGKEGRKESETLKGVINKKEKKRRKQKKGGGGGGGGRGRAEVRTTLEHSEEPEPLSGVGKGQRRPSLSSGPDQLQKARWCAGRKSLNEGAEKC